MEDLSTKLRNQGYDMIDGVSREHRILQIWRKRMNDAVQNDFDSITKIFNNKNQTLSIIRSNALDITSNASQDLKFKIGITVLEDLLANANLGKLELGTKIQKGKKINISFSDSFTEHISIGELRGYFEEADLMQNGSSFLKDLNRDNFIVITAVLFAKNLSAEIESEVAIDVNLDAEVNNIVGGNLALERNSESKITLKAKVGETFPIALKYHKIKYKNGNFKDLVQLADDKDWF